MNRIFNLILVFGFFLTLASCAQDDYSLDSQNDLSTSGETIYKANGGPDSMIPPPPDGDPDYSYITGDCNSGHFYIHKGYGEMGAYGPGNVDELYAMIQGSYSKKPDGKFEVNHLIVNYRNAFYAKVKILEEVINSNTEQINITLNLEIKASFAYIGDDQLTGPGKGGSLELPSQEKWGDTTSLNDEIDKKFRNTESSLDGEPDYARIHVNINPCLQKIK